MELIYGYNIKEYDDTCVIRNTGYTTIRCPTPEHTDKNPSCKFNIKTGDWKCVSCGAEGDINDFTRYTGYALEKADIAVEKDIFHNYEKNIENLPLAFDDVTVTKRIKKETIETFKIRSDDDFIYIPTNFGYVVRSKIYPLHDRKYYYFGDMSPYYTLNKTEFNKPLFIVEGIFGLLRLYELGYNALCIFGSGNAYKFLMKEKDKLQLFDNVYTMFDDDPAGHKATAIAFKYFNFMKYKYDGDIDNLENIKL